LGQHDDCTNGIRLEYEADERTMRDVFVAIKRTALDSAGFDANTVERLMQHRFDLQRAGFRFAYPRASYQAILHHGDVVGRLITDDADERLVLVDVMIDPSHQRQGIGSRVLAGLVARAGSRPLEARLDHGSPAEAWYRSHGFEHAGHDDLQAHLVRIPAAMAMASAGV
jgi:ribosomal protein S18 acetylase RimI-like enzyme